MNDVESMVPSTLHTLLQGIIITNQKQNTDEF